MKKNSARRNNTSEIIGIILIVFLSSAALLLWLANAEKVSLPVLLSSICNGFSSFSNENIFIAGKINNTNIFIYIYLIAIFSSLLALFLAKSPNSRIIFISCLVVFFLVSGAQLVFQIKTFSGEIRAYSGKTLAEKNSSLFGLPYNFAEFCRNRLPGSHRGKVISDLDPKENVGMMLHERLTYHLYPINIAIPTGEPIECCVIFQKENPEAAIPKEFDRRYIFNQFNILAVKEGAE